MTARVEHATWVLAQGLQGFPEDLFEDVASLTRALLDCRGKIGGDLLPQLLGLIDHAQTELLMRDVDPATVIGGCSTLKLMVLGEQRWAAALQEMCHEEQRRLRERMRPPWWQQPEEQSK